MISGRLGSHAVAASTIRTTIVLDKRTTNLSDKKSMDIGRGTYSASAVAARRSARCASGRTH